MSSKIIVLDTETTGLYPNKHGIHQLAGKIVINREVVKEFSYFIRPFQQDEIELSALNVSNSTEEQIARYSAPDLIHQEFCEMLSLNVKMFNKEDKYFILAYNAKFDTDMLRAFFKKNNDNYYGSWFHNASIDVMTLCAFYFSVAKDHLPPTSFKLQAMCDYFKIDLSERKMHNAADDAAVTWELYLELCARLGVLDGISARY